MNSGSDTFQFLLVPSFGVALTPVRGGKETIDSMKCRGENSLCEDFAPNMADEFHDNFDVNSDRSDSPACGSQEYYDRGHGHFFVKKTFHKPTYCHHCTDMLWGLIQQGLVCEGNIF